MCSSPQRKHKTDSILSIPQVPVIKPIKCLSQNCGDHSIESPNKVGFKFRLLNDKEFQVEICISLYHTGGRGENINVKNSAIIFEDY